MSPELKQTLEIIIAGMSLLICLVLLVSFAILANKLKELRKIIRNKNFQIEACNDLILKDWFEINRLHGELRQAEFVMAVSDDISAELVKENKDLLDKVELLKAKLNHKKRPQPCCQKQ